jgi:TonB family protein
MVRTSPAPDAATPRLLVAVGLSLALHALIAISLGRQPGSGGKGLDSALQSPPLMARLAAVVSAPEAAVAVIPAPAAETLPPPQIAAAADPAPSPENTPSGATGSGGVYYFKASELDRRPFPLGRIEVPPPESAAAQAGAVMIRLRISESGRVDDAQLVMSTGIAEFEAAALREFINARFHPGYRANVAVRSEMLIEVTLRPPQGAEAAAALSAAQSR